VKHKPRARLVRTAFAIALVAGLSTVPTATVMACDCALTELPEAIRDAEVAIVGTLIGESEAAARPGLAGQPVVHGWTWQIERSRDPLSVDQLTINAWEDDGANCGITFGANERWLVLGYLEEGRLLTNGCMRNQRIDGSDPQGEETIESLLPYSVGAASPSGDGIAVPVPLLVAGAATLLLGLIGLVAFRRGSGDAR
jgi:hypothetical protein